MYVNVYILRSYFLQILLQSFNINTFSANQQSWSCSMDVHIQPIWKSFNCNSRNTGIFMFVLHKFLYLEILMQIICIFFLIRIPYRIPASVNTYAYTYWIDFLTHYNYLILQNFFNFHQREQFRYGSFFS